MLVIMPILKPVVTLMVLSLQSPMKATMLSAAHPAIVGAVMAVFQPVVLAIVPVFEPMMLIVMPTAMLGHGWRGQGDRGEGADRRKQDHVHTDTPL